MLHYYRSSIPTSSALLFLSLPIFSLSPISSSLNLENSRLLHSDSVSHTFRNLAAQATNNLAAQAINIVAPKATNTSLILAADRTRRKDPLDHFNLYTGGWNITNQHYLASVGFTAAPFFALSLIWFIVFGVALLWVCVRLFCCRNEFRGYSDSAYKVALAFLVFCTLGAIAGSVLLYLGQGNFHRSTVETFDYVVGQANTTVENLKNVSGYLLAAKDIDVISAVLPENVQKTIEAVVQSKLNASAATLGNQTMNNSHRIKAVLASMGLSIVLIAAFMLIVVFFGFLCSILVSCRPFVIYGLVIIGWLLISGTLICSGIFHLLHNAIADTCVAMDGWVQNPTAHTALDDIIPCVDNATARETLVRAKDVTYQIVNEMNGVITNISNKDISPSVGPPAYFNQSGPLVPLFCNPFDSNLSNRACAPGEVDFDGATKVWKNYMCGVSPAGVCTTPGRLTPKFYTQLAAAVNVSYGLYHYGPFLVSLQDCSFIYQIFSNISSDHCPGLKKYTQWIYSGSVLFAASVMFLVICWPVLTRRRKHREGSGSP